MEFSEAIDLVKSKITQTEGKVYDGLIVKILEASNTLDPDRGPTKQTHIAITGEQIDIFPYLNSYGYFDPDYDSKDDGLKSFFLLQIPVRLYRKNIENLYTEKDQSTLFKDKEDPYLDVKVSVQGSRRKEQSDQVQFSLLKYDDPDFISFRKLLRRGDTIVLLKYKGELKYDLFGLKQSSEEADALKGLNNKFYKDNKSITKIASQLFLRLEDNIKTVPDNLSEEQLGGILKDMASIADYSVCAIHSFGIIFGKYIRKKGYSITSILKKASLSDSYSIEEGKGNKLRESFEKNLFGISIYDSDQYKPMIDEAARLPGGKNILLYGVPGAGKSHFINTNYCSDHDLIERVVFHPEYTYSDFVGQILHQLDGNNLKYVFTPGPFTTILKKAMNSPSQYFYLVIEELNRGNAPAIFGEIFQLLDRNIKGESEYSITNFDIAKEIYNNKEIKIKIPSNLWILATMNTSDQNVFTLDTAFQRRWEMKHIKNDISASKLAKITIADSGITWESFAIKVNSLIIKGNEGASSSEDKRLGAYFVSEAELKNKELFAEKVLKYLWDDAFKLERELFFKEELSSFDEVLERFSSGTNSIKTIVREDIYSSMIIPSNQSITYSTNNANE